MGKSVVDAGGVVVEILGTRTGLATKNIVRKINGSTTGSGKSSVAQLVPEILTLLAGG